MIALFIILGFIGWFFLGTLGYIIYQRFGNENIHEEFGLFFTLGGLAFVFSILIVIYERIEKFVTDRF